MPRVCPIDLCKFKAGNLSIPLLVPSRRLLRSLAPKIPKAIASGKSMSSNKFHAFGNNNVIEIGAIGKCSCTYGFDPVFKGKIFKQGAACEGLFLDLDNTFWNDKGLQA